MEAAVVLVLLLAGALLIAPPVALVLASRARREADQARRAAREVEAELHVVRDRLARAEQRALALDDRLSAWTAHFQAELAGRGPVPGSVRPPTPQGAAIPEPAETRAARARAHYREVIAEATPASASSERTSTPPAPTSRASAAAPPHAGIDWERLVGVRLFAWIGGTALFLAASLFLHYSIQEDLVAPPVRVASGLVAGALALFAGDRLRERARFAAHALAGAGVAILYAALFAARVLYALVDTSVAFGGMALVTVTAGLLAVRRDAYFVALLGLLGGMATPYLLSSGTDRPVALFAYVALLSAGIVVVSRARSWPSLSLVGLVSSLIVFAGWADRYLATERVPYALGAVALVCGLFALLRVERSTGGAVSPLQRVVAGAGALAPVGAALVLVQGGTFGTDPTFLAVYVLVVSGGTLLAGRQAGTNLPLAAAAISVLVLASRVDGDLFPARRPVTLASFSLLPAGYFVAWLVLRKKAAETALRTAAAVALAGAGPIAWLVLAKEPLREPIHGLVAYVALPAAGLVTIGGLVRSGAVVALAQTLVLSTLAGCLSRDFDTRTAELVIPVSASGVVFWALPLLAERFRSDRIGWWASAASLPLHFAVVYAVANETWGTEPLGAAAVLAAVLSALSLRGARQHATEPPALDLELRALFGAITLAFVTAAVPLLLSKEWITISWAAEALGLAWLRRRVPHGGLLVAVALLGAAVLVRLLTNPAVWTYHERTATPIFNYYLYTFAVPAAALLVASRLLERDALAARYRLPTALATGATLLFFALLNVEIADYYSTGPALRWRFSGGGLAEDMTYSLAWGAFGVVLLVLGIAQKRRPARIGALFVLVLTIGKVFLHDLWALGALYRVGSIVGLALALLGVSYLIQRFIRQRETP